MSEKASKITQSNQQPITPCPLPMALSATSTRLWNTSKDGDSTTSLGSLCHCLTALAEKKFSLISNLNLPWHNVKPFTFVLSLLPGRRGRPPPLYNSSQSFFSATSSSAEPALLVLQQYPPVLAHRNGTEEGDAHGVCTFSVPDSRGIWRLDGGQKQKPKHPRSVGSQGNSKALLACAPSHRSAIMWKGFRSLCLSHHTMLALTHLGLQYTYDAGRANH